MSGAARLLLGLALAGLPAWTQAAEADLAPLRRLIEQRDYAAAYQLAGSLSAESAGQASFDYLYGIAALETGHTGVAVFALERALMLEPDNDATRLALMRAYRLGGQLDMARARRNTVLAQSQDGERIAQARDEPAIRDAPPRPATRWAGELALTAGYDSNVNATTDLEQLPPPPATVLILDPGARALDDGFARLSFDVNVERSLGARSLLFGGIDGYENVNFQEHDFDTTRLGLLGGGAFVTPRTRTLGFVTAQQLLLDHSGYLTVAGPGAEWQWRPGGDRQLALSLIYTAYRYNDFDQRDSDALLASIGWRQVYKGSGAPRLDLSLYGGDENPRDGAFDYFGRNFYGVALSLRVTPVPGHTPFLDLRWQASDYDGLDPVYAAPRSDDYWRAGIGWRHRLRPRTEVAVELEHTRNDSDIALYAFDRTRGFVTTRYLWR